MIELTEGILTVQVSDPARGSSIDMGVLAEARQTLESRPADVRVIFLTGAAGASFCAGGDVRAFASATDIEGLMTDLIVQLNAFVLAITGHGAPIVAAVAGWAAGAGMSLACLADVVVGDRGSGFRTAYAGIGFAPDGGMSWCLPRVVGERVAATLMVTNEAVRGERAAELGLITHLVPEGTVYEAALEQARSLRSGSPGALAAVRSLLFDRDGLAAALDRELAAGVRLAASADGREGVRAFLDRRAAQFS